MEIIKRIATNNPCYGANRVITVRGLMLHSVGCPQPSGQVFANRMNNPSTKACSHAFIDANDGKIYQILPWEHRAWHCGGSANSTHIGIELCEPACIKYTEGINFMCIDRDKAVKQVRTALASAVELFAFLCEEYNLDPLADGVIISHKEGHDRGIASGHADPDHLFSQLNMNYSMEDFRREVAAKLNVEETPKKEPEIKPEVDIQVGDIVVLRPDAVYYNGNPIPEWVKNDKWIVASVVGDRVIIDSNASGTHSICSAINIKYLKKQ